MEVEEENVCECVRVCVCMCVRVFACASTCAGISKCACVKEREGSMRVCEREREEVQKGEKER